jgi:ribosomal protein S18 acetylase RimI-like enzyme
LIHIRAHVASGLDALPASALALMAAAPTYDLTRPWLEAMIRHTLAPGERVEILWLGAGAGDDAVAVLPLVRDEGRAPIHGRRLRALANYYNGCFAPLIAAGTDADAVAGALAQGLAGELADWEALDLNPMDPADALYPALERRIREHGCYVQRYFRFGNWYLRVAGRSYAEYVAGLPSRLQNTLRRKGRKLAQMQGARYDIVQAPERVEAAMDAWERLYAASWQQVESYPAFMRDVAREFAAHGWLRLGMLWIGEQLAAAQLWFVYDRTASIFKLAFDPAYAEHSVGSLLTAHLMQHAIDVDGVEIVDYLSGDDDYKRDWMSERGERWGLRVYRWRSLAGFAGAARSLAGQLARRGLEKVRRAGSRGAT